MLKRNLIVNIRWTCELLYLTERKRESEKSVPNRECDGQMKSLLPNEIRRQDKSILALRNCHRSSVSVWHWIITIWTISRWFLAYSHFTIFTNNRYNNRNNKLIQCTRQMTSPKMHMQKKCCTISHVTVDPIFKYYAHCRTILTCHMQCKQVCTASKSLSLARIIVADARASA